MKILDLVKKYSADSSDYIDVIDILSDYIEAGDKEKCHNICKEIYYRLVGGHYNKEFADEQIPKMYYEDKEGKHYAPYWTDSTVEQIYKLNERNIPQVYNKYDFEVTLNMIKSDYKIILDKWYDENPADMDKDSWVDKKCVELAVNWLNDEDNPFGTEKVWRYFNS